MFDLSIIRMALEYAQFKDFRIRDGLSTVLKNLDSDLDEVGFDSSPKTKECIEEFESLMTDIETSRAEPPQRFDIDETEIEAREIKVDLEEAGDVKVVKTVNMDEELEEFVHVIAHTPEVKK